MTDSAAAVVTEPNTTKPSTSYATAAPLSPTQETIVPPKRMHTKAAPPAAPPAVPAELEEPATVTAEVRIRDAKGHLVQRKTFTRSAERVHVQVGDGGPEWLFVRNPHDRQRVSAIMVEHRRRTLVEYSESELRIVGLGRGWADVASLGVEPEVLGALERTGSSKTYAGHRFEVLRAAADTKSPVKELWWSSELALPQRLVMEGARGARIVELVSLRRGADEGLLKDPSQRFPRYRVMDVADFREKHHEHGEHEGHQRGEHEGHQHGDVP